MATRRLFPVRHLLLYALLAGFFLTLMGVRSFAAESDGKASEDKYTPRESFDLILSYTDVTVGAGQDFEMDVDVVNHRKEPILVALQTDGIPDGWEAGFHSRYPSFPVGSVMVEGKKSKTLEFKANIPEKVDPTDYTIKITARDKNGSTIQKETLRFRLTSEKVETGGLKSESQYPELSGPASQTFKFSVDLKNETEEDLSASLLAQAPSGWRVRIKPQWEDSIISSIALKKDSSQTLSVEVDPPVLAEAGEYPINFTAQSNSFQTDNKFKVKLTGIHELLMGVPTGIGDNLSLNANIDASAGNKSAVEFLVANTGTAPVQNLFFKSKKPEAWNVEFEPDNIPSLNPGEVQKITTEIQPPDQTESGDYLLTVVGNSPQTSKSINLRVTVSRTTLWAWFGAGILAIILLTVGTVFYRLGQR